MKCLSIATSTVPKHCLGSAKPARARYVTVLTKNSTYVERESLRWTTRAPAYQDFFEVGQIGGADAPAVAVIHRHVP